MTSKFAVKGIIEIGSRGLRILVAELRAGVVHYLHSKGEIINLAENKKGVPPDESRLLEAVKIVSEFHRVIQTYAAPTMIIATEVLRNPLALQAFFKALKKTDVTADPDLQVIVLDKMQEAYYSFRSVVIHLKRDFGKPALVVDMGGGSTEFALGYSENQKPEIIKALSDENLSSLQFWYLMKRASDKRSAWQSIKNTIRQRLNVLKENLEGIKPVEVVALGSSAIDLSRLQIEFSTGELCTVSNPLLNEQEIPRSFLNRYELLKTSMKTEEGRFRLRLGTYFFARLLDLFELNVFSVCGYGLRYGVMRDWLIGEFPKK